MAEPHKMADGEPAATPMRLTDMVLKQVTASPHVLLADGAAAKLALLPAAQVQQILEVLMSSAPAADRPALLRALYSTSITSIDLCGRRWVDDHLVSQWDNAIWPDLRHLELGGCPLITNYAILHLCTMSTLESLSLSHCSQLTGKALSMLPSLPLLRDLDLSECSMSLKVDGPASAALARMRALRKLDLSGNAVGAGVLLRILGDACNGLTSLMLSGCGLTSEAGTALSLLPSLQQLSVTFNDEFGDDGLLMACSGWSARHTPIADIAVGLTAVTDRGVAAALSSFATLRRLTLPSLHCDSGGHPLSSLSQLQELALMYCPKADASILRAMVNLRRLDLTAFETDDDGSRLFVALAACTQLEELNLTGASNLSGAGALPALPALTALNCCGTGLRDEQLLTAMEAHALPQLHTLLLDDTAVTDELLLRMPESVAERLRSLSLCRCTVTDAGVTFVEEWMPALTALQLANSHVSRRRLTELKKQYGQLVWPAWQGRSSSQIRRKYRAGGPFADERLRAADALRLRARWGIPASSFISYSAADMYTIAGSPLSCIAVPVKVAEVCKLRVEGGK